MGLDLTFAQGDGYLLAHVRGEWTAAGMADAVYRAAEEAHDRGYTRIVLDATELSAPESDYHRYIAGEQAARAFHEMSIAVVYPADMINRFGEEVAFVHGAELRVVPDYVTALRWLSGSDLEGSF